MKIAAAVTAVLSSLAPPYSPPKAASRAPTLPPSNTTTA